MVPVDHVSIVVGGHVRSHGSLEAEGNGDLSLVVRPRNL